MVPNYPLFLLMGIVIWTFFIEATNTSLRSILANEDLIRKVNIQKPILVLASVISSFVNFLLNMSVVLIFVMINRPFPDLSLFLPFLGGVIELLLFTLPLSFLLAALYVKFRDVAHIWEVLSQGLFYATPIVYPLSLPSKDLAYLISLNPLTEAILLMRKLVGDTTEVSFSSCIISLGILLVLNLLAWSYFNKQSRTFAEDL